LRRLPRRRTARQTVPIDAAPTPADDTEEGGSPAKKTEQDAAADSSTDSEYGRAAFTTASNGSSRTEEFPVEQSLRIITSTTQQSNDRTGAASRSTLTVRCRIPDRCIGGGLATTALPSYLSLTFVPFFRCSQRRRRRSVAVSSIHDCTSRRRQFDRRGVWRCCCFRCYTRSEQPDGGVPRRTVLEDYNEHDATIKRPDGCCKQFCARGTLPDHCIGGGLAQTALPSCCPLTIVSLLLALAWLTKSQRVDRSEVGVCTRKYSRARRLLSTDQGKGGSNVDAWDADAELEQRG
jgi:hypothetical protein